MFTLFLQLSVSLVIVNIMGIAVLLYASHNNYPGGVALWKLHEQELSAVARSHNQSNPAIVHIDVAAAQQVRMMLYFTVTAASQFCITRAYHVSGNSTSNQTNIGAIPNKKISQIFPHFTTASAKDRHFQDSLLSQAQMDSTLECCTPTL